MTPRSVLLRALALLGCLIFARVAVAAIAIDVTTFKDQGASTSIATPVFSTNAGNELLLAFVAADNVKTAPTAVSAMTGAGLTWTLVRRTNVQRGTAEVWRAFAPAALSGVSVKATLSQRVSASLTIVTLTGVDASGSGGAGAIGATASANANPGAPSATLVSTRDGSWTFGVGNDWDTATVRTPGPSQSLVHQSLSKSGDTFWVQRRDAPTPTAGTSVTIDDVSPATDRYNLTLVEVLPMPLAGTHAIRGSITPSGSGSGAVVALAQNGSTVATTTADGNGAFAFSGRANGTYAVTPGKTGFTFAPASQTAVVEGADVTLPAFTATAVPPAVLEPDFRSIIPTNRFSIVQTSSGKELRYTHDIFNGGPGPLVIQPQYNSASGTYTGTQYLYTLSNTGVWSVGRTVPIAGEFFWHAVHGHFHFPLASFGLYAVNADGTPGAPVTMSPKVGFCIDDSYIYDPSLPNAGALGNLLGSCSDPTTLRGLSIGAVDEYDASDPGQSIPIDGVPDGTYWFRSIVDPENFLVEPDKTNNETDVLLRIVGTSVQVLSSVAPVRNPPPAITLASPADGATISGVVQLAATTATAGAVTFLLDGHDFPGNMAPAPPYAIAWDTTTVANGTHWIAAQTTDGTGVTGTSSVAIVTVFNGAVSAPIVTLESPAAGSTLSATVTLYATVASSQSIAGVTFHVDAVPVGAPLTTPPPYLLSWNSGTVADGPHTFSASATDALGNVGTSTVITANVDNTHPPKPIGLDVVTSVDGSDAMTTPSFATVAADDLLVAYVAFDGPLGSAQSATVSGAGLVWSLLVRSNTQAGTSEIWSARATGSLAGASVTARPRIGGYHGSLTVIAYANASGTSVVGRAGAPSGAPSIYLPGVIAGDWVFAVGNDWDRAIARQPAAGQVIVHQRVDTQVGDTFWVQSTSAPSLANGLVTIADTSPTTDQWNFAAVEVVAARQ